jgi:hypothetical protein
VDYISSIDYIYDKENVYYAKDASEEELIDFVESLNREQFAMIQTFFESIPRLKKEIKFKCKTLSLPTGLGTTVIDGGIKTESA